MPILVRCPCKHVFRADEAFAGQKVPCPGCGAEVVLQGETVSPFDVFISYSSKDKVVADAAVATLETRGQRCWIAPRDIVPGREWSQSIIEGIEQCRMMVLIFSTHSNSSQQVVREVERAVHRGIPIIPFRIEDVRASKAMEYFISTHHWLDAYRPPLDEHLEKLATTAEALLSGAAAPPSASPRNLREHLRAAGRALLARDHRTRVLVGLCILLALIGGTVFGLNWLLREPKASADLIALKAETEQKAEGLKDVSRDHGFGTGLDELQTRLRAASAHFEQKKFAEAEDAYKVLVKQANELHRREAIRQTVLKLRDETDSERGAAEKESASTLAAEQWKKADSRHLDASALLLSARFEEAQSALKEAGDAYRLAIDQALARGKIETVRIEWEKERERPAYKGLDREVPEEWARVQSAVAAAEAATKESRGAEAVRQYQAASEHLKRIGQSRIKGYAYWTGYSAYGLFVAVGLSSNTQKPRTFFGSPIPGHYDVAQFQQRLVEECQSFLDIDKSLFERLLNEKNNLLRRTLVDDDLPVAIMKRYGPEARSSYWFGAHLAVLSTFFEQQSEMEIPRLQENHYDILNRMQWLLNHLYTCGLCEDVVDRLEKARARWLKHLEEPGFATSSMDAAGLAVRELKEVYGKRMNSPLAAAVYFREPAAPRPSVAGHEDALKTLRSEGANLYFERPAPVVLRRVEFYLPPTNAEVAIKSLTGLNTLRALIASSVTMSDENLEIVRDMLELRELKLRKNTITSAGLIHLKNLKELTKLNLYGAKIDDDGLIHLADLTNLVELDLSKSLITDAGVRHLKNFPKLKRLSLYGSKVTDAGVAELRQTYGKQASISK